MYSSCLLNFSNIHYTNVSVLQHLEVCVMRRRSLDRRDSKRMFSRTAGNERVHSKNLRSAVPMRGGIRL